MSTDDIPRDPLAALRDYIFASMTISATDRHRMLTFLDATRPSGDEALDSAYRMALIQIEHDGEVINRLTQALRVANHSPHDQAGEPNEGFPVCSVCGAIQTGPSGDEALRAAYGYDHPITEYQRGYNDGVDVGTRAALATPSSAPDVEDRVCAECGRVIGPLDWPRRDSRS